MRVIILLILFGTCFLLSAGYGEASPAKATSSLTVEECKLIALPEEIGTDSYDINNYYSKNSQKSWLKVKAFKRKREKWRKRVNAYRYSRCWTEINCIKDELKKLNYRLIKKNSTSRKSLYELFKGNDSVISFDGIREFGVNIQKTRFFLLAFKHIKNGGMEFYLLNNDTIQVLEADYRLRTNPIFIGDSLLSIIPDDVVGKDAGTNNNYFVEKDARKIYEFSVQFSYTCNGIKVFFSSEKDWILEYDENVVVSGINIGKQKNYSKVFKYRVLKEKPFYFFKKNDKIHMSYANKVLSNSYDSVLHYMCGEPSMMNPKASDNMIWFYALKKGYLYYVEAGIY